MKTPKQIACSTERAITQIRSGEITDERIKQICISNNISEAHVRRVGLFKTTI